MAVKLSPVFNDQTFDANGDPAVGQKLFVYAAGSSTKQNAYTDSTGGVVQSNPIILNALGYPALGAIWLTAGQSYKFVLAPATDTDPPTSPIKTVDNVTGVNDSSVTTNQWASSGVTPTYVSAVSFTLPGDQTTEFHVGRRMQFTVSAGTVYGTISATVFAALTTVTVVMDAAQALDAGLSAVNLSILRADNRALPTIITPAPLDSSKQLANTEFVTLADAVASAAAIAAAAALSSVTATVAANALTATLQPRTLSFRSATLTDGAPTSIVVAAPVSLVVPASATLGSLAAKKYRYALLAINNAGTVELAICNTTGGINLDETTLISTTAISAAATSASVIYSTTARANVAFRVVGVFDATEAVAGTWATAPILVQGAGGLAASRLSGYGHGQAWQSVLGSRALGTTYYNETAETIHVSVTASAGVTSILSATVGGLQVASHSAAASFNVTAIFPVPPGVSYVIAMSSGTVSAWHEMR